MTNSCVWEPTNSRVIKDPVSKEKIEAPLYTNLKLFFPHETANKVFSIVTNPKNIARFQEENPGSFVLDEFGHPTIESVMQLDQVQSYMISDGFSFQKRLGKANDLYSVGKVDAKTGKIKSGTTNFQDIANVIGAIHRNKPLNDSVTVKAYRQKVNNEWVYAAVIVPKTAESTAELQNFMRGCIALDRLRTAFAKSGISMEIVDDLAKDTYAEFNPNKPKRIFQSLLTLIKLSSDTFGKGGKLNLKQKGIIYEELGHTIVRMFKNNPTTKDAYIKLVEYIKTELKRKPEFLYKFNKILSPEELQLVLQMEHTTLQNEQVEEVLGKIMGEIMANHSDKTSKELQNSYGKINRLLKKARNLLMTIVENTLGVSWKALKSGYKFGHKEISAWVNSNKNKNSEIGITNQLPNEVLSEYESLSKTLSYAEKNFSDRIEAELLKVFGDFMDGKFSLEDATKGKLILKAAKVKSASMVDTVMSAIEEFYQAIDSMGYELSASRTNYDVKLGHITQVRAYRSKTKALLSNRGLEIGSTPTAKFMFDSMQDLKDIVESMSLSLQLLDTNFTEVCDRISTATIEQLENENALEMAANIATLDKQIALLNNAAQVIKYVENIISIYNDGLATTDISKEDKATIENEQLEPLGKLLKGVKQIYDFYGKSALTLQFGLLNNGKLYIDRGARLMATAQDNKKRKLSKYKGRKIPIRELLNELSMEDGYYDMTMYGLWFQSAGNSVDNITQFIDRMTKTNKFKANKENARWHKLIIDYRNYCRAHHIDTSKLFELDSEGNRTGNVVSNINWGLWEKDISQMEREVKAKIIVEYNLNQEGKSLDDLSAEEQRKKIDKILEDNDFGVWDNLTEEEQQSYFYRFRVEEYRKFHEEHSIRTDDVDVFNNAEQLPDAAKRFDESTGTLKGSLHRAEHLKPTTTVDEETGAENLTDMLSFSDLNVPTWVPNLNYDNGRYRNAQWYNLSREEKIALQKYLDLKAELDAKLNRYQKGSAVLHRMPQFRGVTLDRIRTEGLLQTGLHSIQETFFEDSEDQDFGSNMTTNNTNDSFLNKTAFSSFELRQRLPMYGVNKLQRMDQLSTDIYKGLLSYAVMANNVEAMSNVADTALLTKEVLKKRTIEGLREGQRGEYSNIYRRFSKYVETQVFGRYTSRSKFDFKVGSRQFSWNKTLKKISRVASWTALAGNFIGGNINTSTGLINMFKEAGAGEHFTTQHLTAALSIYAAYSVQQPFGSVKWTNNTLRKFMAYWDCVDKNAQSYNNFDTITPQILKMQIEMCHYENGDIMMHTVPYIAKALATTLYERHVDKQGNVTYKKAGNAWDVFVKNCERMTGEGKSGKDILKTVETIKNENGEQELIERQLSMNPYAYETTDENGKRVVRQYCIKTPQYTQELQNNKYLNKHSVYALKDKQDELKRIIDSKSDILAQNLQNYDNIYEYMETDTYKKAAYELKQLCAQYNKYSYLIVLAENNSLASTPAQQTLLRTVDAVPNKVSEKINFSDNVELLEFNAIPTESQITSWKDGRINLVRHNPRRIKFTFDRTPDATILSESDLDYESFNDYSQTQWQDTCRGICNNLHGIYNNLDAVALAQTGVGAILLAMKKFYLGYVNAQFLGSRDSLTYGTDVEGCISAYYKLLRLALRNNFYTEAKEDYASNLKKLEARVKELEEYKKDPESHGYDIETLNEELKKINKEIKQYKRNQRGVKFKSARVTSAVVAHAALSTVATFFSLPCTGAITGPLLNQLGLYLTNHIMRNSAVISQGAASMMSASQVKAVHRAFTSFRTIAMWRIITLLFSSSVYKLYPDEDDKDKWKFYGETDPRAKYPEIYKMLSQKIKTSKRNEEGEYDENGTLVTEISEDEATSQKEIVNTALTLMEQFPDKKEEIREVAEMMLFASSKGGKALEKAKLQQYVQKYYEDDEKFLKWCAQTAKYIFPNSNIDPSMFDDYALKMSYDAKMSEEDGNAINVKGLMRFNTTNRFHSISELQQMEKDNPGIVDKLVASGVISEKEEKALKGRLDAMKGLNELTGLFDASKTRGEQENLILQGLANALDKPIYTDEKMNPKDIVSTTYLYDVIEYASTRLLIEQEVFSPAMWWSNAYNPNPLKGLEKEGKAQINEVFGGIAVPVALARTFNLVQWLGDVLVHLNKLDKPTRYDVNKAYDASQLANLDVKEYNDLPKLQKLLRDYANKKKSLIGDNTFLNGIIDLVLPTQKRLITAQDFNKALKSFHQMRKE